MKKTHISVATVLIGGLALTGCTSPEPTGGGEEEGEAREFELVESTPSASGEIDAIDWALSEEPNSLDPDRANGGDSDAVIANVCEGLFRMQTDLSVEPWLAESVQQPDDVTFVLGIRSGVTFHSGRDMTADDVVWSLERHSRPESGESDEFSNITAIEKTGDMEVTLTLEEPDPQLEYRMAGGAGIILDSEVASAQGQDYGTAGSEDACTGPYVLDEWNVGSNLSISRYDDYWHTDGRALSESVTFTWGDETTVANMVRAGNVDGTFLAEPTLVPTIEDVEGMSIYYGASTGAEKLIPTDRGNATDPRIRKALSLAMDRQGIVTAGLQGIGEPWKSPAGPGAWGYARDTFEAAYDAIEGVPVSPEEADIEQAKELVAEAGVPDGPIVVASNGTQLRNVIANATVSAGEQIGLDVEVRMYSDAEYGELFSSPEARADVDFVSDDWYLSKPEALGLYDNLLPGESSNYLGYEGDEYVELYKKAAAIYEEDERAGVVSELQALALDEMLWIPLASAPITLVLDDALTGAPTSFVYRTYPWAAGIGAAS